MRRTAKDNRNIKLRGSTCQQKMTVMVITFSSADRHSEMCQLPCLCSTTQSCISCLSVCPHLEFFVRQSSIWKVFRDLDADNIISNGLKEEGGDHPQHIDDKIQKDGLWGGRAIQSFFVTPLTICHIYSLQYFGASIRKDQEIYTKIIKMCQLS